MPLPIFIALILRGAFLPVVTLTAHAHLFPMRKLTLFERYMSGGAWMSIETGSVWLAHILQDGDEIPLSR